VQRGRSHPIAVGAAYVVAPAKRDDPGFAQFLAERHTG
jgi:hypothetical protein